MTVDAARMRDEMACAASYARGGDTDDAFVRGHGVAELRGPDGALKQRVTFTNIVTQVGDQMYGERGAGLAGAPAAPTGMALGTGSTAAAKTGAGAALVTATASSAVVVGTPTSSLSSTLRRIQYVTTWAAGVATASGLNEVVLQNGTATTVPSNTVTTNIIARALLSPVVNKGAGDSLTVTWNHDLGT